MVSRLILWVSKYIEFLTQYMQGEYLSNKKAVLVIGANGQLAYLVP